MTKYAGPQAGAHGARSVALALKKISIVTPSFNQGQFVRATIESVLGQGYPNLEYIVVDGGSTDGSVEIIREYADRLHYFISEEDNGHADALNKGFRQSSGEIMAWLNSDDLYHPWTLRTVAEIFGQHPSVEWIVGTQAFWSDRGVLLRSNNRYINLQDYVNGDFQWIQQESVFWRRSLWERAGASLNESYGLMVDGELWTRFFPLAELWHVHALLSGYREHGGNRARAMMDFCLAEMTRAISVMRVQPGFGEALAGRRDLYPSLFYDRETSAWVTAMGTRDSVRGVF
jgi:glycosyltransferase involved in cell wall biosynthesis